MTLIRYRASLALEMLLWIAALVWCVFLLLDFRQTWSLRSLGEFALLALLVWWPVIRVRIKHGYWMRDWGDHPARHFSGARLDPSRWPDLRALRP